MSILLHAQGLSHAAGTRPLFRDVDVSINEGDRIALVGHNGSGKSTLLSLLDGTVIPDRGEMVRARGLVLETVEQFISEPLLHDTLFGALARKLPADARYTSEYQAERLLASLGFREDEWQHQVRDLSGGQQNRLMFARAVINSPDLILFDEPTNHLDLRTLMIFEDHLQQMDCAFLVISHDREFLDAVTDRTLFLRDQQIYSFAMPFSRAQQALAEHDVAAARARDAEEKKLHQLRESARRLALWGKVYDNKKLARKAKTMEKRAEKLEADKTFVTRGSGLDLKLDVAHSRARQMMRIEHQDILAPGHGEHQGILSPGNHQTLVHIDDFLIRPGDRAALLGHNGVGKTTLIKAIMAAYQQREQQHLINFNPQCRIGYYDQELENLTPDHSMLETLRQLCSGTEAIYRSELIRAGFAYADHDKTVAVLSGGERARLMFSVIRLNQPNFLILDEPTNHIDIEGRQELEEQLLAVNATILMTSHDRRFIDTVADSFWRIDQGQLRQVDDPDDFYASDGRTSTVVSAATGTSETSPAITGEDDLLERIIELERLLSEDRARKPKFQKPARQAAWEEELIQLSRQLGPSTD